MLEYRNFRRSVVTLVYAFASGIVLDSFPQVEESACHHSNTQTNKTTKCDGRVAPLIFLLHNADKASADPPIG